MATSPNPSSSSAATSTAASGKSAFLTRENFTPVVIGAFLLMAVTGLLMFFEAEGPLNKAAHEWLGWALVIGVLGHLTANFSAFKRHFSGMKGRVIVGVFALVLMGSFTPLKREGGGEPRFAPAVHAMAKAPMATVAQMAGTDEATVRQRLVARGVTQAASAASIEAAVGADLHQQVVAVAVALGQAPKGDDD